MSIPIPPLSEILGRPDNPGESELTQWYKNNNGFIPPVFEKKYFNTDISTCKQLKNDKKKEK